MRQIRPRSEEIAGTLPRQHHQHVTTAVAGFEYPPAPAAAPATQAASLRSGRGESQGGDTMTIRTSVTIASIAGAVAALAAIGPARAGGDKVAFPDNHAAVVLRSEEHTSA